MSKKTYIILGVVGVAALAFFFLRDGEPTYSFVEVQRGDLREEVFETGETQMGEEIMLGFSEGGKIESLQVNEGDFIERGKQIASLDKERTRISLKEARASLFAAKAGLERLLEGATTEEIEAAEATVRSAETAYQNAKNNLKNIERVAEESLKEAHRQTPHLLSEIVFSAKEVDEGVDEIVSYHFTGIYFSETYAARASRVEIRRASERIEKYEKMIREEEISFTKKDEALRETEESLRKMVKELDNIIEISEMDYYQRKMTGEEGQTGIGRKLDTFEVTDDSTALQEFRRKLNSDLSDLRSLIQSVSSVRVNTDAELSVAQGEKETRKKAIEEAEKNLNRIRAEVPVSEKRQKEAAIEQAEARVELLEKSLRDSTLNAPFKGTVSKVLKRGGEVVSPGEPVIALLPEEEFRIEVFIYEGDVGRIKENNKVEVSFVALEGDFKGEVAFINPVGEIRDGVVYYKTFIVLQEYPEEIRVGMTADVTIIAKEKESVLFVPREAIYREDGEDYVDILLNGEKEKRKVETGMTGERREMEILSGLKEGEKIIME